MADAIAVTSEEEVRILTLDQPHRRNPLDERTVAELDLALEHAARDDVRGVVLTGTPPAFCAGGDVGEVSPDADPIDLVERHRAFVALARRLEALPLPTVAAVNGPARGAGFSLALLCDHLVAASEATFALNFLKVGLPPDLFAAAMVQRRAGGACAADVIYTGRELTAAEAHDRNLVDEVVANSEVVQASVAWAARVGSAPRFAFATAKEMLRRTGPDLDWLDAYEPLAVALAASTKEFLDATSRFRDATSGRGEGPRAVPQQPDVAPRG